MVKGRLSDAGGLRLESQAGRVTGKSTPSAWRDQDPSIKGLQLQSATQGNSIRTKKTPPSQNKATMKVNLGTDVLATSCRFLQEQYFDETNDHVISPTGHQLKTSFGSLYSSMTTLFMAIGAQE